MSPTALTSAPESMSNFTAQQSERQAMTCSGVSPQVP